MPYSKVNDAVTFNGQKKEHIENLEICGTTHLKLSQITPYARKLLALCQVPSLETLLSE